MKKSQFSLPCQYVLVLFFLLILAWVNPSSVFAKSGTINTSQIWTLADSPIEVTANIKIPKGVTVTIEEGVEFKLSKGVMIDIDGQFDIKGTMQKPVSFKPKVTDRWGAIVYEPGATGTIFHTTFHRGSYMDSHRNAMVNTYKNTAPVIIDSCTFTDWPDEFDAKATNGYQSTNMVVRQSYFGEGVNEAVYGVQCPALVEYNTFAPRHDYRDSIDIGTTQNPGPIIRYNVFLGSEDDAIDLDTCDAYVEGNLVMNCRGGSHDPIGISGDKDTHPIIVNNVVINCESGIGFKNGANITVMNNTIINCDKGIWMHQDPAHATAKNNIIWGKDNQVSIKLEPGSTIDISCSIIKGATVYPGMGNSNLDPMFVNLDKLDFHLKPGSPAIDAGWVGANVLNHDFDLQLRRDILNRAAGANGYPSVVDIGAFEYIPVITQVRNWLRF